ncbi:BppU family phage baseplate upper protein [Enterococcus dongliensis]|uniref:BppU family phage baseplate upper protein n=1 Tax=Enterococcus dongliensis TaxID=2559925 RepID=A0ABU3ELQ1_9ENTE|nr:BppU family phage baseplate upper protein [Enterococcus dongliensis]MDT2595641.1 BppU family phage baseplate upper protein [Enterococcus dongliensis]MDT2646859.1 BppU family phage baseplate upper protein [Enterococcus dongliensis]
MFKTKSEIIVIRAEAIKPIDTNVVFWSHDKGTAKLIFQLQKDYMNQPLSAGTIVPILLEFNSDTAEGGRGRHIYHALIEDAVNGIVSIVLEDNILGYQGRVEGSIYIELPDSRSLDTAGRFTFDIKRSPIDENVPELEDYYWQGFNEIMAQYHQTIATIKLEAKTLLDSLTADVTTAQNKVTTLEQSITTANTNLNTRINEINKKIDDNDVFMKQESSANVVYQVIGKDVVEMTVTLDFKNKIAGSNVENLNAAKSGGGASLFPPTAPFTEYDTSAYRSIDTLDSKNKVNTVSSVGGMAQLVLEYDVLGTLKKILGEQFFSDRGASTIAEQVAILNGGLITNFVSKHFGFGESSGGNKISMSCRAFDSNSWINAVSHTSNAIASLTISTAYVKNKISDTGFSNIIIYSEANDGTKISQISTDYTSLEIKIRISANEHIKSMIANNHVENLATPEEAKAGTDTTKTMTPATTAQSIDNRAVTLASNQTIGGLKNFQNEPLVDGIPIGLINEACWCEDFTVNNLAAGIVNPDIQRFSTSNEDVFSSSGKVITIKKSGVYMIVLGVNYSGLTSWLAFGISRVDGTSLVNRNLLGSATSGSNSFTYVRSFEGNDQIRIEFNSGAAGTTMQKINLAIVKIA